MARISKAELEIRVTEVAKLLLNGTKTGDIVKIAADKWGLKRRQVDRYIAYATEQIKELNNADREYEIAKARERYEALYLANIQKKDFRAAKDVNDAIMAKFGYEAPKKTDVNMGGAKIVVTLKDDDETDTN